MIHQQYTHENTKFITIHIIHTIHTHTYTIHVEEDTNTEGTSKRLYNTT